MTGTKRLGVFGLAALSLGLTGIAEAAPNERAQKVFDHWTAERIAAAQPRDLVIDGRGLGYLKGADGRLTPYGHSIAPGLQQLRSTTGTKRPNARPPSNDDTTPPTITGLAPANGAVIGATQQFSATVTDDGGVRSVSLEITYNGQTSSFAMTGGAGNTYSTSIQGFTTGSGSWYIQATDNAKRGGNTATSATNSFTVGSAPPPPPPPPSSGVVTSERWGFGGDVQFAAGRLLYEMADNSRRRRWSAYVCSGTVVTDGVSGRSIIITAAHCVYDDASKAFARNVIFIPNQDGTTGTATDRTCTNDPIGCWAPSFGVVEQNWSANTFPANIPWDYAYYVVSDNGAHSGSGSGGALDGAVNELSIDFLPPVINDGSATEGSPDWTHALGYSYADDPFFMYSAEDMTTEGTDNWWLPSSQLSGGSSGGPWVQPMNESTGRGPLISVNSWGYTTSDGMAGPKLNGTTAECLFEASKNGSLGLANNADGDQGLIVNPATCN